MNELCETEWLSSSSTLTHRLHSTPQHTNVTSVT